MGYIKGRNGVRYNTWVECVADGSDGTQHGDITEICYACEGRGEVTGPGGGGMNLIDCNRCYGSGKLHITKAL